MLTPMGAHRVPYLPRGPTHVLGSSSVLSLHYTLHLETRSNQVWKPLPDHWVQVAAWLQEGGEQALALLAPQCLSRATEPGSIKQAKGGSLNHPPAPPPRLSTSIKPTCWRLTKAARHLEASWAFLQCACFHFWPSLIQAE